MHSHVLYSRADGYNASPWSQCLGEEVVHVLDRATCDRKTSATMFLCLCGLFNGPKPSESPKSSCVLNLVLTKLEGLCVIKNTCGKLIFYAREVETYALQKANIEK